MFLLDTYSTLLVHLQLNHCLPILQSLRLKSAGVWSYMTCSLRFFFFKQNPPLALVWMENPCNTLISKMIFPLSTIKVDMTIGSYSKGIYIMFG